MSYQINTATLAGRLVRDPKITTLTGSEKTTLIARARIAIDRSENKTDFIDIFAMGGRAEYIKKLKKGSPLALTGYIRNANYTTNEGEKKYGNEVVALTVSSEQGGALTANNLYVFGRLTDDPKVHDTANGKFVTFTLAVKMPYEETKRRKKDEGDADADFFRVIVNGKYAEFTEKYLQKGDPVGIPGSIKTDSYTRTEDNQKVYTFDIDAERVSFAISKTEKDARKAAKEQKQASAQSQQYQQQYVQPQQGQAPAQPYSQQQYGQQNGWGGQYGQAQQPAYGQQQPQQYGQGQAQPQYGQQPQQAPAQYGQQNGWGGQYGQAQQPAYGQQQPQQYGQGQAQPQYGQQPQQAPAQYGQQNGWGGQYGQAQQPAYGQQQPQYGQQSQQAPAQYGQQNGWAQGGQFGQPQQPAYGQQQYQQYTQAQQAAAQPQYPQAQQAAAQTTAPAEEPLFDVDDIDNDFPIE